jgi:hypothetical protein
MKQIPGLCKPNLTRGASDTPPLSRTRKVAPQKHEPKHVWYPVILHESCALQMNCIEFIQFLHFPYIRLVICAFYCEMDVSDYLKMSDTLIVISWKFLQKFYIEMSM